MKKLNFFALFTLLAMTLASCNDDNKGNDTIYEQSFLGCFATVTDLQNPTNQTIAKSITMKLTTNWTQQTCEIMMNGLTVGAQAYSQLNFDNMKWKQDGWSEITTETPKVSSSTGIAPMVSDFEMKWLDRIDLAHVSAVGVYTPALEFSFIIDGRYKVVGSRQPLVFGGSTTASANGASFTQTKSLYSIALDFENRQASIRIANAQFADNMPSMGMMEFAGIPFTIADEGEDIILDCAELVPSISGTPYPAFPITALRGKLEVGDGLDLSFNCGVRGTTYTVVVDVDYTSYNDALDY